MSIEVVCLVEETFPRTILTTQVHLLVHLIDEIAICGVVHARWMFFLERFMKTLKDFVRKNARPEGSMAEGWLVQSSLVHISEYLTKVDPSLPRLWKDDEYLRMTSIIPQGKGRSNALMKEELHKLNVFCVLNSEVMSKWVTLYKEARARRVSERQAFRARHGRNVPYPEHLSALPRHIDID